LNSLRQREKIKKGIGKKKGSNQPRVAGRGRSAGAISSQRTILELLRLESPGDSGREGKKLAKGTQGKKKTAEKRK